MTKFTELNYFTNMIVNYGILACLIILKTYSFINFILAYE